MEPGRIALTLGMMAGSVCVWKYDDWQKSVPALMDTLTTQQEAPAAPVANLPTTTQPPVTTTTVVRRWTDESGVVHFEQLGAAGPQGASQHVVATKGTMADYDAALQQERGITTTDLKRAQQSSAQPAASSAPAQSGTELAVNQAYELMGRLQTAQDQIRGANSR